MENDLSNEYTIDFWTYITQCNKYNNVNGFIFDSTNLSLNTWHHVAVVRQNNQVTTYLNGSKTNGILKLALIIGTYFIYHNENGYYGHYVDTKEIQDILNDAGIFAEVICLDNMAEIEFASQDDEHMALMMFGP